MGNSAAYPHLQPVLTRPIDPELIEQQYDQMVKYATALRLGTAQSEDILRRFTRNNVRHPAYRALAERGKARKTIFLCRYLHLLPLRREIHEGLNVDRKLEWGERLHSLRTGWREFYEPCRGPGDSALLIV